VLRRDSARPPRTVDLPMRRLTAKYLSSVVTTLVLAGQVAFAQTPQERQWCESENEVTVDQRIDGCSAMIKAGREKGDKLAEAFNNRGVAYRLKGELNITALEQSFNEVIKRHEILRTVFTLADGNPVQVVLPYLAIKIPIIDLRAPVSEEERWIGARRMFTEEARRPFDLATGPLIRISLLQLANDEYVLLRTMHHIVSDAWSESILFHELSKIYQGWRVRRPRRSPSSPCPRAPGCGSGRRSGRSGR